MRPKTLVFFPHIDNIRLKCLVNTWKYLRGKPPTPIQTRSSNIFVHHPMSFLWQTRGNVDYTRNNTVAPRPRCWSNMYRASSWVFAFAHWMLWRYDYSDELPRWSGTCLFLTEGFQSVLTSGLLSTIQFLTYGVPWLLSYIITRPRLINPPPTCFQCMVYWLFPMIFLKAWKGWRSLRIDERMWIK